MIGYKLSFKDIKGATYSSAYEGILELIGRLYSEHRYLLEGDLLHKDGKNKFTALLNQEAN